jgi:lysophospholipase L1-like esterase
VIDIPKETPQPFYVGVPKIKDAMGLLSDPGRDFTAVVLGDSTGADRDSWVTQVGAWLSGKYDRTVVMRSWSEGTKPPGYQEPRVVGAGGSGRVNLWNGSAPSRNAAYSLEKLDEFVPAAPDLVLISHGHNQGPDTLAYGARDLFAELRTKYPKATVVAVVQNPENPKSIHYAYQRMESDAIARWAANHDVPAIDVESTYEALGDYTVLYKDNVHPKDGAGYEPWARAVVAALSGSRQ